LSRALGRRTLLLAAGLSLAVLVAGAAVWAVPATTLPPIRSKVFDIGPLRLDKIYHSMEGPHDRARFDATDVEWVTGYRTAVLDAQTRAPLGDKYFCHSQLQLDSGTRLMVTATGIPEVRFPPGFGLPLSQILTGIPEAGRGVSVLGMALNNFDQDINRDVTIRVTVDYVTKADAAAGKPLRRLYKVGLPMTREAAPGAGATGHEHHMESGDSTMAGMGELVEGMSQHWRVPPGKQTTSRRFKDIVPVDATVHYALVHLHNYGVWMRLRDVTTGKTLWQTDAGYDAKQRQIIKIPIFESVAGFPLPKDHEYEIETLYDNTTPEPVDAMAMMYLFYSPVPDVKITYR